MIPLSWRSSTLSLCAFFLFILWCFIHYRITKNIKLLSGESKSFYVDFLPTRQDFLQLQNLQLDESDLPKYIFEQFARALIAYSSNEYHPYEGCDGPFSTPEEMRPYYTDDEISILETHYNANNKILPYVGNAHEISRLFPDEIPLHSRKPSRNVTQSITTFKAKHHTYYNSLAVFPENGAWHMHGCLYHYPNGTMLKSYKEEQPTLETFKNSILKHGYFSAMSSQINLERNFDEPPRDLSCANENENWRKLSTGKDASLIMIIQNQSISVILRAVASILNKTAPSMLREIILIDDCSDTSDSYEYAALVEATNTLPKVKITRFNEKRGLTASILYAARLSQSDHIVVVPPYIEVLKDWFLPLFGTLQASPPRTLVFPQIIPVDPITFEMKHGLYSCKSSFTLTLELKSTISSSIFHSTKPVPSSVLSHEIFLARRAELFDMIGYGETFSSDHNFFLDFSFRTWSCEGQILCVPCSRASVIQRVHMKKIKALSSTLRIAQMWLNSHVYSIVTQSLGQPQSRLDDLPLSKVLELKRRNNCSDFMSSKQIFPSRITSSVSNICHLETQLCLSTNNSARTFGLVPHSKSYQNFFLTEDKFLITATENMYLLNGRTYSLEDFTVEVFESSKFNFLKFNSEDDTLRMGENLCMAISVTDKLVPVQCDESKVLRWNFFVPDIS